MLNKLVRVDSDMPMPPPHFGPHVQEQFIVNDRINTTEGDGNTRWSDNYVSQIFDKVYSENDALRVMANGIDQRHLAKKYGEAQAEKNNAGGQLEKRDPVDILIGKLAQLESMHKDTDKAAKEFQNLLNSYASSGSLDQIKGEELDNLNEKYQAYQISLNKLTKFHKETELLSNKIAETIETNPRDNSTDRLSVPQKQALANYQHTTGQGLYNLQVQKDAITQTLYTNGLTTKPAGPEPVQAPAPNHK